MFLEELRKKHPIKISIMRQQHTLSIFYRRDKSILFNNKKGNNLFGTQRESQNRTDNFVYQNRLSYHL